MISSEVQRTLVKSPPELWSELSDPACLARQLGELGEIRIVRVEPEKTVEWAAQNTTGTVSIQPSGWGTKVTLSVTRELTAPDVEPQATEPHAAQHEPQATEPHAAQHERQAAEDEPEAAKAHMAEADPARQDTKAKLEPAPLWRPMPAPRRGFFARIFGRRRRVDAAEADRIETATATETADRPADEPVSVRDPALDGAGAPRDEPLELAVQAPRAFAAASEALAQEAVESHVFEIPAGPRAAVEPTAEAHALEPPEARAPTPTPAQR
ncbi:MAG: hypothetical protein ACRDJX_04870, partial [Solirubrobacteraceae bacterium]